MKMSLQKLKNEGEKVADEKPKDTRMDVKPFFEWLGKKVEIERWILIALPVLGAAVTILWM